jgi:UDP:flavonoid glycosyltransferase YjiC (YdhE family)
MRVLMVTWGWRTHFYPLAPLGWAVRAAGHQIIVASHPSLITAITAAGLPAVAVGPDIDFRTVFQGQVVPVGSSGRAGFSGATGRNAATPEVTPDGGVVRLADALLDDLVTFGRHYQPDLIVHEHLNIAAAVAAAALRVPAVRHLWGPDSSTEMAINEDTILAPRAARYHAGPVHLSGTLTLDPCPPALQVPLDGPSRPIRFVPYNGTAVLPGWLWRPPRRPRVCVTWGTMLSGLALTSHFGVPAALRALASLDADIVLALEPAQHAHLGELPANVRLATEPLALHLLLPSCQLLVHQGGAGTLMTGAAAGLPQLILPQVADQHFNAWRLTEAGAGAQLADGAADPAALRLLAEDLLHNPRWRERATALRTEIETAPAPADLIPQLRALTRHVPQEAA